MAQPPKSRIGFDRRAQYRLFTGYVVAIIGAFSGLFLLALSYIDPQGFSAIRMVAREVTAPVSSAAASMRAGIGNGWQEIGAYVDAGSKNAALQREVESNRTQLVEAAALKQENQRLKRLLGLTEETEDKPIVSTRLISSTAASARRFATIGAGRNQGVTNGQPVQSTKGLIGRVIDTGPNSAQVLLITDPQNVVPVKRARDGIIGFAEGRSDGTVAIRLVNVGINPFEPGDIMVTSGSGGLYRPNIPVALIDRLTSDGAIARILSDPAATDFVLVQPIYLPELVAQQQADNSDATQSDTETDTDAP